MEPPAWSITGAQQVILNDRSASLRYPSFHRRAVLGQQTYAAGRVRWRNRSHQLARERRVAELGEPGVLRRR